MIKGFINKLFRKLRNKVNIIKYKRQFNISKDDNDCKEVFTRVYADALWGV